MNKTCVSAFGFIVLMVTAIAWAAPVPDTGQSKCYNNTVEIPCPSLGQPFYGQDANYSINPMSYTKLDSSGNTLPDSAANWSMVKDNVTGLIWEMKTNDGTINDKDKTYTWYDPTDPFTSSQSNGSDTKYFIDALNIANFGGYGDWRMPTIKEMGTIINYNIPEPGATINTSYFPNTQASFYWSSPTYAYDTNYAWGIDFYYGQDNHNFKYLNNYVRAVRGGKSGSLAGASTTADGYGDNGDGTVTDTSTGLMWQAASSFNPMTWEQALAYCEDLDLGGYTDWRLPTKKVLRSLVDFSRYDPSINTTYFPDTVSSFYWSSTTNIYFTDYAWGAYFYVGDDLNGDKLSLGHVRAVRGGQAPTPTGCMATLDGNLLLHIPYVSYIDSILGTLSLWGNFAYEFNPTYPTLILFKMTNAGTIYNPSNLCAASTLSADFKIHIPDVLLQDGSTHLWVDLEYDPALSTVGNAYFIVTNYGTMSN
ncbi:MAG: DUF1566 domain-containing protein [Deltaproteobacteria bacterium]|nr:DUF1566 domain-containing protein [Deltaproteobacteria bacterium]